MSSPGILEQLRERSRSAKRRIIFPEQSDPRVHQAVTEIQTLGACEPIVLTADPAFAGCETFDRQENYAELLETAAASFAKRRARKGIRLEDARKAIAEDPLLLATILVDIGYADAGVAGSVATTASVLKACLLGIGMADRSELVSSTFLIDHRYRLMTYGDCGVTPDPDARQLACIAVDSARTHQLLTGESPKVALLSFSTMGSAEHSSVDKVREALQIARELAPELAIDGEFQADAALIPQVGRSKAPDSPVAGQANVLIFPDLSSGNIAYKLTERLGEAQAIGPILQGLNKPWIDLSRGCKPEDIVNAAAIASALTENPH